MPFFHDVLGKMVFDLKTPEGQPVSHVRGDLFTTTGKWKYTVYLDYSDLWPRLLTDAREKTAYAEQHPHEEAPGYLDPHTAAWVALNKATAAGVSGVTVTSAGRDGYRLVVLDPPNGYPVMA